MISEETRKKLRESHLGKKLSEETKLKIKQANLGRVFSEQSKKKMRDYALNRTEEHLRKLSLSQTGPKGSNWKGGISKENERIRKTAKYKKWVKAVFERDSFTCVWCNKVGGTLNADHIKPYAFYPELRFELSNGRTLCVNCHRKTDTYGRKAEKGV
jgi:hypothetical protein